MTVSEAIRDALADWGDHPCILDARADGEAVPVSAAELGSMIAETALRLGGWGIAPRSPVALFLGNSVDFVVAFAALLQIGAVPIVAKLEYRSLELEEIFDNARPDAVVCERSHLDVIAPHLRGDTTVVTREPRRFSLHRCGTPGSPREGIPDDVASVNYTYRGYGYPLGALIPHETYLHGARELQAGLQAAPREQMLVTIPMCHIFAIVGCILTPLLHRLTIVVTPTIHPLRLSSIIRALAVEHVTSVPEVYGLLARTVPAETRLPSLRTFVCGGSVLALRDWSAIRERFSVDLLHGYGLTEVTPVSRNVRGAARAGTIGPVCAGLECRIHEPDGAGIGEIQVRGPTLGARYHRRPQESADALLDGWFRTGDAGRFDRDHLVFERELKGTRKVNGLIVDLAEVARALRTDPEVGEAEVTWSGGSIRARVGLARSVEPAAKIGNLRAMLRNTIAGYKIPREIESI